MISFFSLFFSLLFSPQFVSTVFLYEVVINSTNEHFEKQMNELFFADTYRLHDSVEPQNKGDGLVEEWPLG